MAPRPGQPGSRAGLTYRKLATSAPFWIALVTLVCMALKSSPSNQLFPGADKFYHWLGFATLAFTAHIAFPRAPLRSVFIWTLIGGASIEVLQTMIPGRTTSLADMTVNIVGVLTGLAGIHLYRDGSGQPVQWRNAPRRRKRRRRSADKGDPASDRSAH